VTVEQGLGICLLTARQLCQGLIGPACFLNARFSVHSAVARQTLCTINRRKSEERNMERRHFLGLAFGLVAGTALAASAGAAPLSPQPLAGHDQLPVPNRDAHAAVTSTEEVEQLKPEQVHWGRHWHHRWHRRHWGWRRHHWHRHHWRRHW
jgi:hypothetical protein